MPHASSATSANVVPHTSRQKRLQRQQWLLGTGCTLLVVLAWAAGAFNGLELPTIDWRTKWFNRWAGGASPDVVVMSIDDRSVEEVDEWPWGREIWAEAVDELRMAGAKTIALDVMFSSAWTGEAETGTDPDASLARAMTEHGGVVLPLRTRDSGDDAEGRGGASVAELSSDPAVREVLEKSTDDIAARIIAERLRAAGRAEMTTELVRSLLPAVRAIVGAEERSSVRVDARDAAIVPRVEGQVELPIPSLTTAAAALGDVVILRDVAFDTDFVYRKAPLWRRIGDDRLWAAFSLAAVAQYLEHQVSHLRPRGGKVTEIPTDPPRRIASMTVESSGVEHPYVYVLTWPRGGRAWAGQFNDEKADVPRETPITAALRPMLIRRATAHNLEYLVNLLQLAGALQLGDYSKGIELVKELQGLSMRDQRWELLLEEAAKEAMTAANAAADFLEFAGEVDLSELAPSEQLANVQHRDVAEKIPAILAECRSVRTETDAARVFLRGVVNAKLVFVGWTATSVVADSVTTSLAPRTPGVYIHAAIASSMLTGFVRQPVAEWVDGVFVVLLGIGGIAAARRASVWLAPVLIAALIGAWLLFASVVLWDVGWRIAAVAAPSVAAASSWLAVLLHRLLVEQRMRRRTEERFRAYVSPAVVDELVNNPELDSMTPQRRELTIMFCDVTGFTAIAEKLGAEGTAEFLKAYLGKMTDTLLRHGATIDKYLGDGIMAFWGAPIQDPRHARNACRAATALARAVTEIGLREMGADGPGPLRIRIGLAAGDVMVGDFGNPPIRSSYTVLGDACNIAARLERACKLLGTTIVVSATVRAAAGEGFLWRPLGKFVLHGRLAPEPIFELVGMSAGGGRAAGDELLALSREPGRPRVDAGTLDAWVRATEAAVEAFAGARWDEARERFAMLAREFGDEALARVYLAAIEDRVSGAGFEGAMDAILLAES